MSTLGKPPSQRQLRVGEEIRRLLSETFSRGEVPNIILFDASVTVTEVCPSPDLRHAKVFVMPLGGKDSLEIMQALKESARFLQSRIAKGLTTKYVPRLQFHLDHSFDEAGAISKILNRPDVLKDLRKEEGGSPEQGQDDT